MANNINNSFLEDLRHDGDFSATEKGDLRLISGRDNLRQAILHRIITSKGTIIHRPEYGVGIKSYQGIISSIDKQRNLALEIRRQLVEDDRIESVDSVKFTPDPDSVQGTFIVNIKVTAAGLGEIEESINPFDKES